MSANSNDRIHPLGAAASAESLPVHLNDPFDYIPHPLCRAAADEVFRHLGEHPEWQAELAEGKMFGVLIIRGSDGEIDFLAAFSGNLAGSNDHPYFVPPIYDMLRPDDFFRRGEAEISAINRRIASLESDPQRIAARINFEEAEREAQRRVHEFRERMRRSKALRDTRRAGCTDADELRRIDDESRYEKSEYRRLKEETGKITDAARTAAGRFEAEIARLKADRRHLSEDLQHRIFLNFRVVDSAGRKKNLCEIFADTPQGVPPSGAGECAAPKLLQYAFLNSLEPLAIAEFWYGASPKGEVRRHGCYYTACRGKCKPILDFMLQGIMLEPHGENRTAEPTVVYEDESVAVVDKPAGMLSVAGKIGGESVEAWAKRRFSEEARPVHRLDMATSGLLLIAKNSLSFKNLQEQFLRRTIRKRYAAILEGEIEPDEGRIELPMRPDPADRPRQVIDRQHGKSAITLYKVKERRAGRTLIEFEPITGRTHQLRVHSASVEGLNAPIVGDTLYGAEPAARLCLHNEYIEFSHPLTGERLHIESPADQIFTDISSIGLRGRSETESAAG